MRSECEESALSCVRVGRAQNFSTQARVSLSSSNDRFLTWAPAAWAQIHVQTTWNPVRMQILFSPFAFLMMLMLLVLRPHCAERAEMTCQSLPALVSVAQVAAGQFSAPALAGLKGQADPPSASRVSATVRGVESVHSGTGGGGVPRGVSARWVLLIPAAPALSPLPTENLEQL